MNGRDARAHDWLEGVLGRVDAVEEHRDRPWGAIWKVWAAGELYWLKLPAETFVGEVPLVARLAELAPDDIVVPVAMHEEERWILTRDEGTTLAPLARDAEGARQYPETAAAIARVQRAAHGDPLMGGASCPLPRFRQADFLAGFGAILEFVAAMPDGHPLRLGRAERRAVVGAAEELASQWSRLAGPLGEGLDHNDLHLGNAYPGPRISDWSDAVVAHPFATLRPLVVVARTVHGVGLANEVRAAYLEAWGTAGHGRSEELELAMRMASVQRFHAWRRIAGTELLAEWAQYVRPLIAEVGLPVDEKTHP